MRFRSTFSLSFFNKKNFSNKRDFFHSFYFSKRNYCTKKDLKINSIDFFVDNANLVCFKIN